MATTTYRCLLLYPRRDHPSSQTDWSVAGAGTFDGDSRDSTRSIRTGGRPGCPGILRSTRKKNRSLGRLLATEAL